MSIQSTYIYTQPSKGTAVPLNEKVYSRAGEGREA